MNYFKVDCVALNCNSLVGKWIDSVSGWSITIILVNAPGTGQFYTYYGINDLEVTLKRTNEWNSYLRSGY